MNLNVNLRKISLNAHFKAISLYFGVNGPIGVDMDLELGNQQRPTLERIGIKLGRFI